MKPLQPLGRIFDAIHKVWSYIGETEWESYKREAGAVKEKEGNGKQDGE